ncbi:asparagine synthase (glutamine-hydrolyzing) AsnB protein (plasmid) [Rhizobium gallicum]|uniref:asparagine synthase (glutamine-hydrolyzing) n=1 Tax=Rhizobium gallicum TaxID=56730 RepID=A0A1L5NQZ0_9HYPH|nr:asparagine synthase (glutamine-hydrolyzing) [Rhizobium gallicum]APO70288.1 asparagine synthase (glutamine-hydrolyzing) AsnB protein [Rhizobium gallicum]
MCGIFGFIAHARDASLSRDALERCAEEIAHRGPDAGGCYIGRNFGFAHRRLSIIDLDHRSNQPFVEADTGIVITYNGEIYNFRELRVALEKEGAIFRTASDTEVICKAFARWGIDCLHMFRGMFAFALYDPSSQATFLVRDRLGIKPLYYADTPTGLAFSSQPSAILRWPGVNASIDPIGVSSFLSFRAVFGERSLFSNIKKLPPGTWLRLQGGERQHERWWSPRPDKMQDALIQEMIGAAVEEHLVADTPVATFLSGGLDSSILAYEITNRSSLKPTCFTGVVEGEGYDESPFAAEVAATIGAPHRLVSLPSATDIETVTRLISLRCHPLGMHNETAMYLLAERVGADYKVVLTGEGADELFAGYSRIYRLPFDLMRDSWLAWIPARLGRGIRRHIGLPNARFSEFELLLNQYAYFPIGEKLSLATKSWSRAINDDHTLIEWMKEAYLSAGDSPAARIAGFFVEHHLTALLEMVDNTTMAAGVEARVPFTDHRIVERALSMRPAERLRWRSRWAAIKAFTTPISSFSERLDVSKVPLRDSYSQVLPSSVITRKKLGFPLPLGRWAAGKESRPFRDLLFKSTPAIADFIDIGALKGWYDAQAACASDAFGRQFWLISNLEIFLRQH